MQNDFSGEFKMKPRPAWRKGHIPPDQNNLVTGSDKKKTHPLTLCGVTYPPFAMMDATSNVPLQVPSTRKAINFCQAGRLFPLCIYRINKQLICSPAFYLQLSRGALPVDPASAHVGSTQTRIGGDEHAERSNDWF